MGSASRGLNRRARIELLKFQLALLEAPESPSLANVDTQAAQLRWLLRRSQLRGGPDTVTDLILQPRLVADLLRAPGDRDRWHTSTCLQALRNFANLTLGVEDGVRATAAVESGLIPRESRGWYEAERVTGGRIPARRAIRLLAVEDLLAICVSAREGKRGAHALRDEVLVRLFCFSPLRPGEIRELIWEQLTFHDEPEEPDAAPFSAWVTVQRKERRWDLPIHRESSRRLASFCAVTRQMSDREPEGPVFLTLLRPYRPLSYREIKEILERPLRRVASGLQHRDLRAAYAYHLMKRYRLTVPDLREALGLREVKHAQQLVASHLASDAKRLAESMASKATREEEQTWLNLQFLE